MDRRIKQILSECEAVDEQEKDQPSLVRMKEQLKSTQVLKSKVENILKELKTESKKATNTTDPECTRINSTHGSHAGYNIQSVVDEKHGLIVSSDVVNKNNDVNQFANQIEKANETLEKKCQTACADCGYADTDELEKIDKQGIKVIVPSRRQASKKVAKPFDKTNFHYDPEKDCFTCPQGHILKCIYTNVQKKTRLYQIFKGSVCRQCPHFGVCTKHRNGRKVSRLFKEQVRQKLEAQYEQAESQEIYKLRQQKVELPFGHIKRNLKVDGFLLRGLDGVKAEASLLFSCFNISRMISIIGVSGLISKLSS